MMKTYRSLSVFLIAVMLVGLCACGSKEGNAKGNGYKKEVDTYTPVSYTHLRAHETA